MRPKKKKKKFWGISAEATAHAAGGPASMGDELGSVKAAKKLGPDVLQAPACPLVPSVPGLAAPPATQPGFHRPGPMSWLHRCCSADRYCPVLPLQLFHW